jgi:hypothetical protein
MLIFPTTPVPGRLLAELPMRLPLGRSALAHISCTATPTFLFLLTITMLPWFCLLLRLQAREGDAAWYGNVVIHGFFRFAASA